MNETISFEEIGLLLALAAARDQRIVGDADGLAWHSDLNAARITYRDADAALTRFYAVEMAGLEPEDRRRVTTPDVIGIARKIRAERLANFVYEPPPGDDDPLYLERLRGQIAATADGRTPALTELPALEGRPHRDVAKMLAGVGRSTPDIGGEDETAEQAHRPGPIGVACPTCQAAIGRPCKIGGFDEARPPRELRKPHAARARVASGGPAELESPDEIAKRRAASLAKLQELAEREAAGE